MEWSRTTHAVLTLERVRGTKIDDVAALDEFGVDRELIAQAFARTYLSMVFVDGFFPADPHPGNVFVEEDSTIAMVDFGMVGSVSGATRTTLVEILVALAASDVARYAPVLETLGVVPADVDRARLTSDITKLTLSSNRWPPGSPN